MEIKVYSHGIDRSTTIVIRKDNKSILESFVAEEQDRKDELALELIKAARILSDEIFDNLVKSEQCRRRKQ